MVVGSPRPTSDVLLMQYRDEDFCQPQSGPFSHRSSGSLLQNQLVLMSVLCRDRGPRVSRVVVLVRHNHAQHLRTSQNLGGLGNCLNIHNNTGKHTK